MLPLELSPAKNLCYVYQGARSFANIPGNAALCEPIDLQSERPNMNGATFYKHCRYIYTFFTLKVFKILHRSLLSLYLIVHFLITPATETVILQIFSNYAVTIIIKIIVSLARVIKKFTIMSHPSHTVTIIKINVSLARVIYNHEPS